MYVVDQVEKHLENMFRIGKEHNIDVVVVNGENIAGGRGISRKTLDEIYRAGADIVTSGNHIWDQKEIAFL